MHFSSWLAFLSVALLACFSPGPGILLAVSNAMSQGLRKALISSSGNALGICLVATVTTLGLGAVLKTSATLFLVVKIAGAGYLIYLGIKQWTSGGMALPAALPGAAPVPEKSARRLFQEGLWVAVTNPKSILFFTALFPQFMHTGEGSATLQFVVLTATFCVCSMLSHMAFVLLARRARGFFNSARGMKRLNRGAGTAFIVLGVSLLGLQRAAAR